MSQQSTQMAHVAKGTRRKWTAQEDQTLVNCMVELHTHGTHNGKKGGFEAGYLSELAKMMSQKLPHSHLEAKPHIESRIRTLKQVWQEYYDLLNGRTASLSGFGWDPISKMITASNEVWEAIAESKSKVGALRRKSLWYYEQFCAIYSVDRATGATGMECEDMVQESEFDPAFESQHMQDVNDSSVSGVANKKTSKRPATSDNDTPQSSLNSSTSNSRGKKKGKSSSSIDSFSTYVEAASIQLEKAGLEMSRVDTDIADKTSRLPIALGALKGMTLPMKFKIMKKMGKNQSELLYFYGLPDEEKMDWCKWCLEDES
ncbi:unnamed protein product [Cuscuta europaea]|uniref:Myb/SANT-like domain-containing protein n=2 Tax=Cuscuta europaea TaxID=41803 RepID=A0A9P0ZR10_CUSEU|nr:unnamed protein product [Cuscuta europaea]